MTTAKQLPGLVKGVLAFIGSALALYTVAGPYIHAVVPPNVAMIVGGIAVFLTAVLHDQQPITDFAGVLAGTVPFQAFLDDLSSTLKQHTADNAVAVQAAVQAGVATGIAAAAPTLAQANPAETGAQTQAFSADDNSNGGA